MKLVLLFALALAGCADMMPTPEQMAAAKARNQAATCNYDGAFEYGVNAAKTGDPMNGSSLASYCPPDAQAAVMKGYRAGYMSVQSAPVVAPPAPVVVIQQPPMMAERHRECLTAYGRQECGYGCRAAGGMLRCAQDPRHDCMVYAGRVWCGLNCHGAGMTVFCDESE